MFSNKALKKLILPLIIEQILIVLVGMADTVMVSYAGEAAISGVALVDMLEYLIITILSAIATGGVVIVSQYFGGGERNKANLSASQLLTIAALFSTAIMAVCLLFHSAILRLLFGSVDPNVMEAAMTYFVITALSFPSLGIYNSSAAIFRSMQKTNITMYVSLLMNIINIVGNAIGIFVFHGGVAGVAIPTLLSRTVAAVIMTALAFNVKNEIHICPKEVFLWNKNIIKKILSIAIPSGIENGLFAFGRVLVTSIVALFGTTQIAANGVANSIDQIAVVAVSAVGLAVMIVVGQCIGACEYEQARFYTIKLMKISYICTAVIGAATCILLPNILSFYKLSSETSSLCFTLIVIHNLLAIVLHPTSFNLPNSLRAAGDVRFTLYIGVGSMLIFRLGTAVLLGIVLNWGIIGVWIAMGMDWTARSIAFTLRFKSEKWKAFRAI